jgi:hypothetical protein
VASQLSNNNCVPVRYPNLISLYQATTFMPDVFDFSSEERAESVDERGSLSDQRLPAARPKRPPKRGPSNQYTAWTFKHELECDLFYAESTNVLTIEEKTNLQKEHLRNRLQHDQPRAVLACAVLVDSRVYSGPPARVSIPVTLQVMFRPKKPPRFLWKRGSATEAFGRLCSADSAGAPSSMPTSTNPRRGRGCLATKLPLIFKEIVHLGSKTLISKYNANTAKYNANTIDYS